MLLLAGVIHISEWIVSFASANFYAPNATYLFADLRTWGAEADPVDVLVSNATLQWVSGHLELLPQLVGRVRPGGWFAFQVPGNFGEPSHTIRTELAAEADSLPSVLSHGDACPNNLLAGPDGDFVMIDFGFLGAAPVAFDLSQLLVGDVQIGRR